MDQVLDNELLTVECLEQRFGLSTVTDEGPVQVRRRRRRRRHRESGLEDGSGGRRRDTLEGTGPKRRRHGWDVAEGGAAERPLQRFLRMLLACLIGLPILSKRLVLSLVLTKLN